MPRLVRQSWLALFGLVSSACALAGYDFGDYEQAQVSTDDGASAGAGGADTTASNPVLPIASTFGVGGETAGETAGESTGGQGAGGESAGGACEPQSCFQQQLECGQVPTGDGCGQPLDCGACFWWFQECRLNRCKIAE
jgi:hypothetical protein